MSRPTGKPCSTAITALKAITFSSSIGFLIRLADRLDDMEVVFGAERILSREHLALLQASQTVQSYGFADALADQKALVEALSRLLGRSGSRAAEACRQRQLAILRLLRGRPSFDRMSQHFSRPNSKQSAGR